MEVEFHSLPSQTKRSEAHHWMKEKRIAGASSLMRNISATDSSLDGDANPTPTAARARGSASMRNRVRLCCMSSPTRPTFPLLHAAAAMISSKNTIRIKLVVIV